MIRTRGRGRRAFNTSARPRDAKADALMVQAFKAIKGRDGGIVKFGIRNAQYRWKRG